MICNYLLFFFFLIGLVLVLEVQSWRSLCKDVEQVFEEGDLKIVVEKYSEVYSKKCKKEEFIYKVGEIYFIMWDYCKVVEVYCLVKDKNDDFLLVGLKFVCCFK